MAGKIFNKIVNTSDSHDSFIHLSKVDINKNIFKVSLSQQQNLYIFMPDTRPQFCHVLDKSLVHRKSTVCYS